MFVNTLSIKELTFAGVKSRPATVWRSAAPFCAAVAAAICLSFAVPAAASELSPPVQKQQSEQNALEQKQAPVSLATLDVEALETALLDIESEIALLEEDLLYPPSSKVAIYLSMDVGELFRLDHVKVELNGKEVAHHLYTELQSEALYRGGLQPLAIENVPTGKNEITAFFLGEGPHETAYKRATSLEFEKTFEPVYVELSITDSTRGRGPEFSADVQ